MPLIPAFRRLTQGDPEFKAGLDYIIKKFKAIQAYTSRSCLKKKSPIHNTLLIELGYKSNT